MNKRSLLDCLHFNTLIFWNKFIAINLFLISLGIFNISVCHAQNLESIGQKDPLKVTGSVAVNQILYGVQGIKNRRDPYSYYLNGNLNFDLYGWSVPFSFSYSNQNTSFRQPFNQFGLHPTYKYITGHIGYSSMNFSPYTLGGRIFLGVGVDVNHPTGLRFSGMYGRLQKAIPPNLDSANNFIGNPVYTRMGYGFKLGYGREGDFVDLILFQAKDDVSSLPLIPDTLNLTPQENIVLSINGGKRIFKKMFFTAEYATSAVTRDTRATNDNSRGAIGYPKALFNPKTSTSFYNAFKTGVNYQGSFYTIGLGYEKVAPEYQTFGAYYFNNNLENITANATTVLFKNKVNVGVNIGSQRNNLNNTEISTMRRLVSSLSLGYVPNQRISFNGSYSNFQTYTNIRSQFVNVNQLTPYDNLDTLDFTQISQSSSLNTNYILSTNKDKRQSININLSMQKASENQGSGGASTFINSNASYSINLAPINTAISASINANTNKAPEISSTTLGPTIGINRTFLNKKLRTGMSSSLNNSYADNKLISRILNFRLTSSYTIEKKHSFNLSGVILNRANKVGNSADFTEFTCTLGYTYNFGLFTKDAKQRKI